MNAQLLLVMALGALVACAGKVTPETTVDGGSGGASAGGSAGASGSGGAGAGGTGGKYTACSECVMAARSGVCMQGWGDCLHSPSCVKEAECDAPCLDLLAIGSPGDCVVQLCGVSSPQLDYLTFRHCAWCVCQSECNSASVCP